MAFVWHCCMLCSKTGVPKLANIYVLEGVHLTLAVEGKNMFIYHSFPIIYAYISEYNGRLNNFFLRETTSALSLPFLGCCRWNANGCSQNTSPFLHHKENAPCYGNSRKKWALLAAIVRYIMIIFSIGYLQIWKRYFCTNVLPLRLTKPQITILFYLARLVSVI